MCNRNVIIYIISHKALTSYAVKMVNLKGNFKLGIAVGNVLSHTKPKVKILSEYLKIKKFAVI